LAARFQTGKELTLDDLSSQLRSADEGDSAAKLRVAMAVYAHLEGDARRGRALLRTTERRLAVSRYSRELLGELAELASRSGDDAIAKRDEIKRRIDRDITILLHPLRVESCRNLDDDISRKTFDMTLIAIILHDRLEAIEAILQHLAAARKANN
jgi:hypothetical protein